MSPAALALHIEAKGDPAHPPVLMLHGLLGSARNLARLTDGLVKEGFYVVSYDQRGHGRSPWADDYTVESMAADAFSVLDSMNLKAAHFVGHSLGGRVTLAASAIAPERMLSLTLLDVGPVVSEAAIKEISMIIDPLPPGFPSREEAKAFLSRFKPGITLFLMANLKAGDTWTWAFDLAGLRKFLKRGLRTNQEENFKRVRRPMILIWGENSKHLTAAEVQVAQSLNPALRTGMVPGAGHWLHADNPQDTLRLVTEFLRAQGE